MSARDYIDSPLDAVTQDNVAVDLRIGPEHSFERGSVPGVDRDVVKPTERARRYDIIDAEVEVVDGEETNYLTAIVIGDGHDVAPSEGNPLDEDDAPDVITLDIDNELTENERGGEITRVFTGVIANASRLGGGQFEFVAFWPGFNEIQSENIILHPPVALYYEQQGIDYSPRREKVSEIARRVSEKLTRNTIFDYRINVADGGVLVGVGRDNRAVYNGFDPEVTIDSWREPIKDLLDSIQLKSESIWEVDRYGDFYFGAIDPEAHKLRYITDNSAGKMSPAWQSVRVIGDGVVSEDGWQASALINEDPEQVQGNINDREVDEGLAEPTFVYRNMEINTEKEAQHVMNELREKIRDQAAGGNVEVVGHPEVWPGDAIELPDAPDQPFQLDRFGVKRVIHRLNNDDGFMTKIECGGLTNAKRTLYQEDVSELVSEERLEETIVELKRRNFVHIAYLLEQELFDRVSEEFRDAGYYRIARLADSKKWVEFLNAIVEEEVEPSEL